MYIWQIRDTNWLEDLVQWWRTEIDSQFDDDGSETDHNDYWYYQGDTDDKSGDEEEKSPSAKKPNIVFVLADDWGKNKYCT